MKHTDLLSIQIFNHLKIIMTFGDGVGKRVSCCVCVFVVSGAKIDYLSVVFIICETQMDNTVAADAPSPNSGFETGSDFMQQYSKQEDLLPASWFQAKGIEDSPCWWTLREPKTRMWSSLFPLASQEDFSHLKAEWSSICIKHIPVFPPPSNLTNSCCFSPQ